MNIVIIEKSKIRLKKIVNTLLQNISNIKLYAIFFDFKEAIRVLNNDNEIDIIIFDNYNQKIQSTYFLKLIDKIYNKKIIFVIEEHKINLFFKNNNYILVNEKKMINNIYKIKEKIEIICNNDYKTKIKLELKKLKFNFSLVGTKYLIDVIYETKKLKENKNININLLKDVFPVVSTVTGKSIEAIHSGLKRSIANMYYDCEEGTIKEYFGIYFFEERPRLKKIILDIINKIEKE